MIKGLIRRFLSDNPGAWGAAVARMIREPQPTNPRAVIVMACLGGAGLNVDGKVSSFQFLPGFFGELRKRGFHTELVFDLDNLAKSFGRDLPIILVHVFGEDHTLIGGKELEALEAKAAAVFNSANVGPLLADKMAYHKRLESAGIAVPALQGEGGFVRERTGTMRPTSVDEEKVSELDEAQLIRTEFVDTTFEFEGGSFFTTARLLCIGSEVMHAYIRARDTTEGNPSVHAKDTPLNPALIEQMQAQLIEPREAEFAQLAQGLAGVLGDGFFVHDLLIDRHSGRVLVCESGIKFDDMAFWKHMSAIADQIPSHAPLLPVEAFAVRSAQVFADQCDHLLS